jgi:tetratricopeptide (TPR) repeat protein
MKIRSSLFGLIILLIFGGFYSCKPKQNKEETEQEQIVQSSDNMSIDSISSEIRKNPRNSQLFILRSELYAESGNLNEAINDLYIAKKLDSLDTEIYYSLIDYHMKLGQSGKAKDVANKCLKIFPGNKESLLRLAQIYYYVQEYAEALEYLRQLKSYNHQDADSYFIEALIYKEMNQPAKAIQSLKNTLDYDENFLAAYVLLGDLLTQAGDPLALEYYKAGLRKAPENLELLYNLGYYYQINNLPEMSLIQYSKILEITDSLHYGALYNSAYIDMVFYEQYDDAVYLFSKAINIDSSAYKAYYNRGYAYELSGELNAAEKDYKHALQIEPNYPLAIEGLNELDKRK